MKNIPKEQLSRFRQEISILTEKLKNLGLKAGYGDLLFGGTPVEFYKKCGKAGCRCCQSKEFRHGPYRGIQLWQDGKQKHLSLKKSEDHFFEMAKRYQYQQQNRCRIVEVQEQILSAIDKMIKARTIWKKM